MTRILALTNFYPPESVGGDRSAADVLDRLARRHEVTVLTSDYRAPAGEADPSRGLPVGASAAGPEVIRRLRLYWRDHDVLVPSRPARLAMEWSNRRALAAALSRSRPEVVCVWTMGAFSFGLFDLLARRRLPLVYAICNDWLVWGPDQDAWMKGFADRPGLGRVATALTRLPTTLPDVGARGTFLFVSDWTRHYAEEHSRWSFPDAAVVYSGIDAEVFRPDPTGGFRPWSWRLLYVGRLDPDKGPITAIETLALLPPEATLLLAGPGSPAQREALERRAAELGVSDRARFGVVPRTELAEEYRRADALLFPSRWQEPFGLTPLEAMACATPVVGTALGGSAEFLRHEVNCLVVPPENPEAMADALRRLAGDGELRNRMMAEGPATASRFGADALAACFEEWLVGAAGGYTSGRPADRSQQETA